MREIRAFVEELVEHWDDSYWWADRQLLLVAVCAVITGSLGVAFAYLEGRAKRAGLGALT